MPLIRVNYASPLSPETTASLLEGLTDAYVAATGGSPDAVHVVLERVPPEHWAIGGVSLADRTAKAATK